MTARRAGLVMGIVALACPVAASGQSRTAPRSAEFINAATGVSLDEAVQQALRLAPPLREMRSEVDAARGMRVQAGLRPNPEVMLERRDAPTGMDAQTMASVEWPLELGRRRARISAAERNIRAAELGVADQERRLAAEVRTRYGAVLTGARVLDVLADMVEVTRQQRDLVAARVDAGGAPAIERDALEIELGRLEADLALQTGRVRASVAEVRRIVAVPPDQPFVLRDTLEDVRRRMPPGAPALRESGERSDLREARAQVAVADARVEQIRQEARPALKVFAGYMRMDNAFSQLGQTSAGTLEPVSGVFHYATGGVKFTLPFNRAQGDAQAARAAQAGAQAAVDAVSLTVDAERRAATAQLEAAQAAVRVLETTRTRAKRLLDVVGQSYQLGRGTLADVLAERRRYVDVERAYVETAGAEYEAAVAMDVAMGGVR